MKNSYSIGVLTPYTDGEYFNIILTAIHAEIQLYQGEMIVVEAFVDHPLASQVDYTIATNHVDGWIIITEQDINNASVGKIKSSGKPYVLIGSNKEDGVGTSVQMDNIQGMKVAVQHLIRHGHKEIAFVGALHYYETKERLKGYKEALVEANIPYREELILATDDHNVESGIAIGEELVRNPLNITAIAVNTDRNAVGIMQALRKGGYSIPQDIAVTGFDNMEVASTSDNLLTTIDQPFEEIGRVAVSTLMDLLSEKTSNTKKEVKVPAKLVERHSCGCEHKRIQSEQAINEYEKTIDDLKKSLNNITYNHFELIRGLMKATQGEDLHFSDLFWNTSHWGCLALWDTNDLDKQELVIHQVFSRENDPVPKIGERYSLQEFPPVNYLPETSKNGGPDIVIIHSVLSGRKDWGFVVLAGPVDKLNKHYSRDLSHHSFAILASALERNSLFKHVKAIAEQLEIVSKTTNDGIWDYNLVTNEVEWNNRVYSMLGSLSEQLTSDPSSFLNLVYEDDLPKIQTAVDQHLIEKKPYQIEFRIKSVMDKHTQWIFAAGEAIRDSEGRAIRMIGSFTDITEKKLDEERITKLAYHDSLTGLANRLLFYERLKQHVMEGNNQKKKVAVCLLDLDRFKNINDTLGHQIGDKILQHVAKVLKENIREHDVVARLGGDEFIILFDQIKGNEDLGKLIDKILSKINVPFKLEKNEIFITGSIGVSIFPDHSKDADTLVKYADIAMYEAKSNGGNQMMVYTTDMRSIAEKRYNLEKYLRKAIEHNEFKLYYQPVVNINTGMIIGLEALIRWESPQFGLVMPGDFIPLAEENGFIMKIGTWVLREACYYVKKLLDSEIQPMTISINISAQQFRQSNFVDTIKEVLDETNVPPYYICLEITENMAIHNINHSITILKELEDLGVKIAIDDFGTGHSSLMLLKRLPIHIVKIDKSFIMDMTKNQDDVAIVDAVIAMSHSLELSVIAEGVEKEEHMDRLIALNCDFAQGYYISKPMAEGNCVHFIENYNQQLQRD